MWTRQIERQLNALMKRIEDVLGKGWEQHVEGQKLKSDCESFRYVTRLFSALSNVSNSGYLSSFFQWSSEPIIWYTPYNFFCRLKLNTQEVFDQWSRLVQQKQLGVTGRIFGIENVRGRVNKSLRLKVNFLPEIITLSKEVYIFAVILLVIVKKEYLQCILQCILSRCETWNGWDSEFRSSS